MPKIVSSQVTNTFAIVFWSSRWKLALVCTVYRRVHPAGLINVLLFTRGGQKEISWPNVKSVLLGKGGSGEVSRKPVDRKARQIAHPSWCGSCWKELNARKRQQLRKDRGRRSQLWLQLWK